MKNNKYADIVLHSVKYDSTAMPVENLLKCFATEDTGNIIGKLARVKDTGYIGKIIATQKCYGYDENNKYTFVNGCRIEDKRRAMGSFPCPLNEIEIICEEM